MIGLSRQSHDFDENKRLDPESTKTFPPLEEEKFLYFRDQVAI